MTYSQSRDAKTLARRQTGTAFDSRHADELAWRRERRVDLARRSALGQAMQSNGPLVRNRLSAWEALTNVEWKPIISLCRSGGLGSADEFMLHAGIDVS